MLTSHEYNKNLQNINLHVSHEHQYFWFIFRKFASINQAVGNVFTMRTLENAFNPNCVRIRANLHLEVSRTSTNSFVKTDKIFEF